jgi:choline kinase
MGLIQRNIEVDSGVWSDLKADAIKRNKNVRELAGDVLADYLREGDEKEKKGKIKAIIIAAGMSSRMAELTEDKPKCMLEIGGKTILQRQIETFRKCGISDITVIRGYKKEKINYTGVKYVYSQNYRRNNILESLMYAESEMDGEFIVVYSDILFEEHIVKKLLKSRVDIAVVVDTNWMSHYKGRYQHPIEEAEKVIAKNNKVVKIAKSINPTDAHGEFIGMGKFSGFGAKILKRHYMRVKKQFKNRVFHTAISIEKAELRDMFSVFMLMEAGWRLTRLKIFRRQEVR